MGMVNFFIASPSLEGITMVTNCLSFFFERKKKKIGIHPPAAFLGVHVKNGVDGSLRPTQICLVVVQIPIMRTWFLVGISFLKSLRQGFTLSHVPVEYYFPKKKKKKLCLLSIWSSTIDRIKKIKAKIVVWYRCTTSRHGIHFFHFPNIRMIRTSNIF